MRGLIIVSPLTLLATAAVAAPPAETNVHSALERIARVDPQIHSVIAGGPELHRASAAPAAALSDVTRARYVLEVDQVHVCTAAMLRDFEEIDDAFEA